MNVFAKASLVGAAALTLPARQLPSCATTREIAGRWRKNTSTGPKPGYAYMTTAGSGAMKITPDIVGAIAARVAAIIAAVSGLASRT